MARMLSLKSDHHWSEACYDQTSEFIKSILPEENTFIDGFYNTKKHMEGLGLPSVKIDCCVNGCMIYWGEDTNLDSCKFCSQSRMMRRPIFHKSRTPDQTQQPTQQRTPRTPELTQHSTPEMSQHHTPDQTPQNTPRQTPDPDTSSESSTSIINGAWKVGTMHDDGCIRVKVIEGVGSCSTQITSIMHERLEPKGFAWKSVSKDAKKFYFEEFKKWFVWRQEDNLVYEAWQKSAAYRYKDLRSRARGKWEKKKQLDNRIGKDVWLSWIEEWKTPECQKKTEIKRDNRKGGVVRNDYPATHTAGSSSHRKTEARLEKIKSLRAERSQPADGSSTPQPVDENQLFYDAVGGRNSRNKIYGLGSSQDLFYAPSSSTIAHFSNSSHPNSQDYEKLQTELEVMKERMKEMDTMQQRMKDMENLLARMADNQMQ
ncbi:hypothetical protein POM88_043478 [Heracleum sosnowskyi]|uniref:Transposase n=1 Tax=Heracleum sosnowskyi TaxID=360622 RepID=A0AAD8H1Z9_9APIA|nr:hypothetical protein POM88_043478 [Heracleum sosnowskyi]